MIFRQVINEDLSCASYLLADSGEAAVVDPGWDIEPYLRIARAHRLTIRHVFETHVHADHVSGRNRLVAATGATAYLPLRSGVSAPHRLLRDGEVTGVGAVRIETIATPGHRPEHVSFLVTDTSCSDEPCLLLSGDSLLVGGLARPDLAVGADEVRDAARALYHSLRRISALPDHVEVWPAHIGGSLCAATAITGRVSSTIGFERRANPGFALASKAAFVDALVKGLPERPPTVEAVVAINRAAQEDDRHLVSGLLPREVRMLVEEGALVIDGRSAEEFDVASIPGSLSIPLDALAVGSKAAWLADPTEAIVAVASDDGEAREVVSRLAAVGLRNIKGILRGGLGAWQEAGLPIASTTTIELPELASLITDDAVTLIDVRDLDEFDRAHVPGSHHVPWREIRTHPLEASSPGKPVVVACATGRRTPIAASAIARMRAMPVVRLAEGGINDLAAHGVELVTGASQPALERSGG